MQLTLPPIYPMPSIIVVAPHAVRTLREDGSVKPAEVGTSELAAKLSAALHCDAVIATVPDMADPSWPPFNTPFRQEVLSRITPDSVLIDIHGMRDDHGVGICFGRGPAPGPWIERFLLLATPLLTMHGIPVAADFPFDARGRRTLTAAAQNLGGLSVQIEVARYLRSPELHQALVPSLESAVRASLCR